MNNNLVPRIKNIDIADEFFIHYLKFEKYIEIEEQQLGRKLVMKEKQALLLEFMLNGELKELYGSIIGNS